MKICIILGTRPEIIKLSSIIRKCEMENLDYFIIHTGQHYSKNMDEKFFDDLNLPTPKYNLKIGSGTQATQTAKALEKIEEILIKEKPDVVLVQGDTNTVLSGALAARKIQIKVGHVEAGLRSYDQKMPEEINRIITDHISNFLFVPTRNQKEILLKEGIPGDTIHIVGNTITDAIMQNHEIAKEKSTIMKELRLKEKEFILVTAHRPSNVDNPKKLLELFSILQQVQNTFKYEIVFPIHPRTKKILDSQDIKISDEIKIIEPVGFIDFICLEKNSKLIITDSGGVQEEACILKTPCITIRDNTERPETVDVGANEVTGYNKNKIFKRIEEIIKNKQTVWDNPFGDGTSGEKILEIIRDAKKK